MKIALISGSPRGGKTTSLILLKGLKEYLNKENIEEIIELVWNDSYKGEKDFEEVLSADAIVFAFPLYVDSIPSHLLNVLVNFEEYINKNKDKNYNKANVYAIVNNGFFDGKQNCLALENIGHFCKKVGFNFKGGIGIGGGGMLSSLDNVPFGSGPKKNIGNELSKLAKNIKMQEDNGLIFTEPNFPRFLYKIMAQIGWRNSIKKNGLKLRDLKRKIT